VARRRNDLSEVVALPPGEITLVAMYLWPMIWMPIAFIGGTVIALFVVWLVTAYLGLGVVAAIRARRGNRGQP
jgi:hypothetical protein